MPQSCTNQKCDNQKATPVLILGNVVFYICEDCGKKFTIGDQGFASQEELEQLQDDYTLQMMATGKYKPVQIRSLFSTIGFYPDNHGHSIKLHNPMDRIGVGCTVWHD